MNPTPITYPEKSPRSAWLAIIKHYIKYDFILQC